MQVGSIQIGLCPSVQAEVATTTGRRLQAAWVVRLALATLLVAAAELKGIGLKMGVYEFRLFAPRLVSCLLIAMEVLLALWLVSGLYARWACRAALLAFGLFACVSAYRVSR